MKLFQHLQITIAYLVEKLCSVLPKKSAKREYKPEKGTYIVGVVHPEPLPSTPPPEPPVSTPAPPKAEANVITVTSNIYPAPRKRGRPPKSKTTKTPRKRGAK